MPPVSGMPCIVDAVSLAAFGCTIKKNIKIEVPQKILQAKTASFDELLGMLQRYDRIHSLSSFLDVTYFSGKKESGVIQEIKKQPGYILLRRPDSTILVVQNFVTRTRELEVLSVADDLSIYYRRENALYVGKNSAKNLMVENGANSSEFHRADSRRAYLRGYFPAKHTDRCSRISVFHGRGD